VIEWAQYEKWWEPCQKRSGQLFYGCDDVAGVTYVCPRGCDIIADYPPTLTSPQQHSNPLQYRSHPHRLRCHSRCLPNGPTYTTHTQSIRGGSEYHPRSSLQRTGQSGSCCSDRTTRCSQRRERLAWFLESRRSTDHVSANTSQCRHPMGAGGELWRDEGQANWQSQCGGGSARGSKMGMAAAQEGAKWERRQPKRDQQREQNGSGGSPRGINRGSKMGAAAAQEGAKWERQQHKREQIGSGGSTTGSKMGAAAAQEGANWERRQRKREQKG
jgi:hypothetical protein